MENKRKEGTKGRTGGSKEQRNTGTKQGLTEGRRKGGKEERKERAYLSHDDGPARPRTGCKPRTSGKEGKKGGDMKEIYEGNI
jgi:hypothetical protein